MSIKLPPIKNYPPYDFSKLINAIEKNIAKLKNGSNRKPSSFYNDIVFFKEHWLRNKEPAILNTAQLRSVSIHLLESKTSFQSLLEAELLPKLLSQMEREKSISIKKRIVEFYFKHYFLLKEYKINIRPTIFQILKSYQGHNNFMLTCKTYLNDLLNPKQLLKKFESINDARKILNLSPDSDFFKYLIVLSLIKQLENIKPTDHSEDFFQQIKNYKNIYYDEHILIGEYVVRVLVEKIKQSPEHEYTKWINFIIELAGDPRAISIHDQQNVNWNRIGKVYRDFLIEYLSKEDLALFLEVLSDPEYDEIYRYRKAFWKPFEKHLRYAKLFINKNEFERIDESLKQRFKQNNSAYSFTSDSKRSFIYMDFGTIKVIEGTHNAKVRLYRDTPIDISQKNYNYWDFYKTSQARNLIIDEITHSHSEIGTWQKKVFNILKFYIPNIKVTLRETLLL